MSDVNSDVNLNINLDVNFAANLSMVFKYLASQYKMTEYGIGSILKRYGIYESADKPVVPPKDSEIGILLSTFFSDYTRQPATTI